MKSTLVATAIASALSVSALAQNVTLSGVVDVFAGSMQYSGDKRTSKVDSNGMTTSWWGLAGTEDLGGGLKMDYKLSAFFRPDSGASGRFNGNETFFSRDAWVGLSGGFGSVHVGRDVAPNFLPTVLFNAFGDSFAFSPLVLHANVPLFNGTGWSAGNAGDTGWSNQIRYTTPNIGGFTANLHDQFGEVAGTSGNRNYGANVLYFNGPISLGGYYHSVRANNPGPNPVGAVIIKMLPIVVASNENGWVGMYAYVPFAEQKAWMLAAKLAMGSANVYANYEQAKNSGVFAPTAEIPDFQATSKTWSVSADVAAGPGKFLAAYANTKLSASGVVTFFNPKRETFSLGYDYALSKRTDAYVVYMNDKITEYDRGNSFAMGVRHKF